MLYAIKTVMSIIYVLAVLLNLIRKERLTGADFIATALLVATIAMFWI